jgi:hypothetical protein
MVSNLVKTGAFVAWLHVSISIEHTPNPGNRPHCRVIRLDSRYAGVPRGCYFGRIILRAARKSSTMRTQSARSKT